MAEIACGDLRRVSVAEGRDPFFAFHSTKKSVKHGLGIAPRENSRLESETALDNFLRDDSMRQVCLDVRFEQMHTYHKI